jgi:hypothetical protein
MTWGGLRAFKEFDLGLAYSPHAMGHHIIEQSFGMNTRATLQRFKS